MVVAVTHITSLLAHRAKRKSMSTNIDPSMELDDLQMSSEYADYIIENAGGERVICNGDTLIIAMEEGYLWKEFLESLTKNECE